MRVFISYRRGDAVALAGRLYDRLGSRFGPDSVFMDQEDIPVGAYFGQTIADATALEHRIAIIPVLLGDTAMPRGADLPDRIRGLVMRHALRLEPGERFNSDFERLMRALSPSASPPSFLVERLRSWFRR